MKKQDIYRLLEGKMLSYKEYASIPVRGTDEGLVPISTAPQLTFRQIDRDMLAYTGEQIYVREDVLRRLVRGARILAIYDATMKLEVVYGYRALDIQRKLFERYKEELSSKYQGESLLAAVHRLVAVPEAAGHPTGAAVDIQIVKDEMPLDFGTRMHEFVPDTCTFSPFISPAAWRNRQLLRRVMIAVGFAPFDGEWWHFSYGDKEWAAYYQRPAARYEQISFRAT